MIKDLWPQITETTKNGMRSYDIPSRLLVERVIMLTEEVNNATASSIIGQLLLLEQQDDTKPITMYINSPGGSVTDGLAIYDMMQHLKCKVNTICVGCAASMAAILLAAGTGKRYATRHSTIMIHQPMGQASGQATEMMIRTNQILKLQKNLYDILTEKTGMPYEKIQADCERDYFMTAEEALEYHIIDEIS